jgi:hypothetical protein
VSGLLGATPGLATGVLDCTIADASLALDAAAVVRQGPGGHVSQLRGKLHVRAKAVPEAFRNIELKPDDLTQRCLYGNDLRLRIYRDRGGNGPSAELDLVIETRRAKKESLEYSGTYVLTVAHVVEGEEKLVILRGRATCSTA